MSLKMGMGFERLSLLVKKLNFCYIYIYPIFIHFFLKVTFEIYLREQDLNQSLIISGNWYLEANKETHL